MTSKKTKTTNKGTPNGNVFTLLKRSKAEQYYGYKSAEELVQAVLSENAHPPTTQFMKGKTLHLVDIAPPAALPEATYGIGVEVFGWRDQTVVTVYGVAPPWIPGIGLNVFEVGLRVLP